MSDAYSKYDQKPRPPYDFYYIKIAEFREHDKDPKPLMNISTWVFKDFDSAKKAFETARAWSRQGYPNQHHESENKTYDFEYFTNPSRRCMIYGGYFSDAEEQFES